MSRSKAYTKFSKTVRRAWHMANIRNGLLENDITIGASGADNYDDLGRASIVLAVAAMDSYFTDAFIEKLIPFLKNKKPTKDLVLILEKAGFGVKEALGLLHQKQPYTRIKKILEQHLEPYVTQSIDKIDKLFKAYGFESICKFAEGKTRKRTIITSVKTLVNRRHKIVHDGDYMKSGKLNKFNQRQITRQVKSMEDLVSACDELLFP